MGSVEARMLALAELEDELPPEARIEDGWIIIGQEAWTIAEWRKRVAWEMYQKTRAARPEIKARRREQAQEKA